MLPATAAEHYRDQQRLAVAALAAGRRAWSRMGPDFDSTWQRIVGPLTTVAAAAQLGAARAGIAYVPTLLAETGQRDDAVADVSADAFTGLASDGRDLDALLYGAVTTSKQASAVGAAPERALGAGRAWLDMALQTLVADANRTAVGVAIAARPSVGGFTRMLNPPSCGRCAVLAGKFFKWNRGFERHPRCDCRHIPTSEGMADDFTLDPRAAIEAGQVTDLSEADHRAIVDDGADVGQVINATRGMYTANAYGVRVQATQEGVTKRGVAGQQMLAGGGSYQRTPRLRPESIYQIAGDDRAEAIRLLTRFGYLI